MSDLDAKLYAALAGCKAKCLPINFCDSETGKWELLAMLERSLRNAAPKPETTHEQAI